MKKVFSKKVATVCIAIAITFSLMSFSENENQSNYGISSNSKETTLSASVNEDENITSVVRALVTYTRVAGRVIVNAAVEAAEFVAAHYALGNRDSQNRNLASIAEQQEMKFKNLD